jgi:hypothetical protein
MALFDRSPFDGDTAVAEPPQPGAMRPNLFESAAFHLPKIEILQKLCVAGNSIQRCHVKQSPEGVTAVECGFAQHRSRNSKPTVIARIAVAQPEHKR